MQYFQAMCYKNLGKFNKAQRDYGALTTHFKHNENEALLDHVVGVMLLTLNDNRYQHEDLMRRNVSLIHTFNPVKP
jgi:hypothetical protein